MDEEWENASRKRRRSRQNRASTSPGEIGSFAAEPEESTLPYVIGSIGDDKLIFRIGLSPHWDGMFPYVVSTIRERKDISDGARQKLRRKRQTALRLGLILHNVPSANVPARADSFWHWLG